MRSVDLDSLVCPQLTRVWTHQQCVMCRWPQRRCVVGYHRNTSGRNSERLPPPGPHSAATCTESADLDEQKQRNYVSFLHSHQSTHPHIIPAHYCWKHDLTSKYQRWLQNVAEVKYHSAPAMSDFWLLRLSPSVTRVLMTRQNTAPRLFHIN